MKNRLYEILFPGQNPSTASKACNRLIVVLIFLNVIIMIAETFSLPPAATKAMQIFEVVSLALFTIE